MEECLGGQVCVPSGRGLIVCGMGRNVERLKDSNLSI